MQLAIRPTIWLRLTPHFDSLGVSALSVRLEIFQEFPTGQPMFVFNTFLDNVPAPPLEESDVIAIDDQGALPFKFVNIPTKGRNRQQHWCPVRAVKGTLVIAYDVSARKVDKFTPVGTRIDLRRDQGGLQGVGKWFLPQLISDLTYTNVVEWRLPSNAPQETRCLWSFGEGPKAIKRVGKSDAIWDSVYMAGPIRSYPETKPEFYNSEGFSVCHWFGSLPENLDRIKGYNTELFPRMMAHFRSHDETYHVFIRKVPFGYGGTGFLSSYVLEYDETIHAASDDALTRLFTHEMVHSFSKMDHEDGGYDNAWFTEGIAEFYSALLPYRFGLRPRGYWADSINSHVRGYFTSPRINMDMHYAMKAFFDEWYVDWIAYKRGCSYLVLLDAILRRASGKFDITTLGPLDDIVIDMAQRTKRGEMIRSNEWFGYLRRFLGEGDFPFEEHFYGMIRGETLDFSMIAGHPTYRFFRCDRRILEYGLDRSSLRTRHITGVIKDSPPDRAGIKDGDVIVKASNHNQCAEDIHAKMTLVLQKGDREETIVYLPRLDQTTLSYELPQEEA
ncbi:trypsin-like serine typically contains c-terminal pdz domain protein [Penicillium cataractarum]|uniref:Trypsin-like serine typically contains c-terminal pdz domain protein n=1 Tax=Penicillium cataractarum TaxID=2100454 RepID=A0A9W9RNQ8_9EURO|nr:trypsin-like serine typically contains c-terminal pdz domain protein [Penicillium cataractarum]KAJ5363601.1 trypsin-like serine typically contains c-terminal pdz domain protein [Penicillium cataractarum]